MSRPPAARIATAGAIGAAAVLLGVLSVAAEVRHGHVSHAAESGPSPAAASAAPALPDVTPAPQEPPALGGVVWGSDGVLRVDGHVVVNKSFALPESYGPGGLDPAVAAAFEAMRAEAAASGMDLWILSGYRAYVHQAQNYQQRVAEVGVDEADRGMARPGHSEHQTGLAIDVNDLSTSFGATDAGRWVAANAHRFGFVVRYPEGKEHVTGFKYEPWHLRYLGVPLATTLTESGQTLEERYGLPSTY